MKRAWWLLMALLWVAWACRPSTPAAFTSEEGRFSVRFPKEPFSESVDFESPWGPVQMRTYNALAQGIRYTVSYLDFPDEAYQQLLPSQLMAAMVAMIPGELVHEEPVVLDRFPGRALRIELPDGRLIVGRTFLNGQRVYQVLVAMSPDQEDTAGITDFLDSFQIEP